MVTHSNKLLEGIWKDKDCVWLGNFECTEELRVDKKKKNLK